MFFRGPITVLVIAASCSWADTALAQDPPVPDEAMSCEQIATQIVAWRRSQKDERASTTASTDRPPAPDGEAQRARDGRLRQLTQLYRSKQCATRPARTR